jgi:hypothetical protein
MDLDYLDGTEQFYPDDTDWGELESGAYQEREAAYLAWLEAGGDQP